MDSRQRVQMKFCWLCWCIRWLLSVYQQTEPNGSLQCACLLFEFMYFGVVSPGFMNDNILYPLAPGLKEVLDALSLGCYAVADAAYTLSECILIPYTGTDRLDPAQDSFNYCLSQLRIHIELAIGRLINKFRILSGKINGSLDRVTRGVMACAWLHSFNIKEDQPFANTFVPLRKSLMA
ncbi:hypothetical protein ACHAW6_001738 [Cyclotella cf. meneghiniana]